MTVLSVSFERVRFSLAAYSIQKLETLSKSCTNTVEIIYLVSPSRQQPQCALGAKACSQGVQIPQLMLKSL